eukprot:10276673-Karenia_brevis.AAC.1
MSRAVRARINLAMVVSGGAASALDFGQCVKPSAPGSRSGGGCVLFGRVARAVTFLNFAELGRTDAGASSVAVAGAVSCLELGRA